MMRIERSPLSSLHKAPGDAQEKPKRSPKDSPSEAPRDGPGMGRGWARDGPAGMAPEGHGPGLGRSWAGVGPEMAQRDPWELQPCELQPWEPQPWEPPRESKGEPRPQGARA